jgi:hypothetical protein
LSLQIEGGEFQLDPLSCWHDNGDIAFPVIIPVVGWEVKRLDITPVPFDVKLAHIVPQAFGVHKKNSQQTRRFT